jgi:hypothetical protein
MASFPQVVCRSRRPIEHAAEVCPLRLVTPV